jgi:phosphatidylglycerophosphate synthase
MWTGLVLLYIAALLTLWSMFVYLQAAWLTIKNNDKGVGE